MTRAAAAPKYNAHCRRAGALERGGEGGSNTADLVSAAGIFINEAVCAAVGPSGG